MTRAYAITADAIATERARVNDDLSRIDISKIIQMDTLTLPAMSPREVKFRTLAVSAEHNLTHAATAELSVRTSIASASVHRVAGTAPTASPHARRSCHRAV